MKHLHKTLLALILLASPAWAGSTINPTVPAANSPMASAPIRNNFAAAYNDVNNILTDFMGPSAPVSPSTNQSWMDTTVSSAWALKIYDGSAWVRLGTLNPIAHTFTYTGSTVPLPTPTTLGGLFSQTATSHNFLTGLGTDGTLTHAQPATSDISGAGTTITKNTGKSVADPGTGALEGLLPVQTVTGASKTYATADLQYETRRSNSGSAMTDTFPSSSASGMANGARITLGNADATASDTITAGAGTSFASGPTEVVEAGRAVSFTYDSASSIWRTSFNTKTAALFTSPGTLTPGNLPSINSAYGKMQDSGVPAANVTQGAASSTTGNVVKFADASGKVLADSGVTASLLVTGPGSSTTNHIAAWNGTGGTAIADAGAMPLLNAGGRLTLASGVPVMVSTQSAKATLYYTCYVNCSVPYYNGSIVQTDYIAGGQVSTAMASTGTGVLNNAGVFDVWYYQAQHNICIATNGSGGGWASDTGGSNTARGSGYSNLDYSTAGFVTNANALTHCYNGTTDYGSIAANRATYLGTIYTTAAGQTTWQFGSIASGGGAAFFDVFNFYNRVQVNTFLGDSTDSWSYTTASTWRAANNSSTMRVNFVRGVNDDGVEASYNCMMLTGTSTNGACGVALDTVTSYNGTTAFSSNSANLTSSRATYATQPGVGFHLLSATEYVSSATGVTFYGDAGQSAYIQSGMTFNTRM